MKINNKNKERAIRKLISTKGINQHEAIEEWLAMPQKEQREFVSNLGKKKRRGKM